MAKFSSNLALKILLLNCMSQIPSFISTIFLVTTFLSLYLFYRILSRSTLSQKTISRSIYIVIVWIILQIILSRMNVYNSNLSVLPPRILIIGIFPAFLCILLLFTTKKGRLFLDSLPILELHYLHMVRIPVEIVLYLLFIYNAVPELMTFEGRNFDILAGISAPMMAYFGIKKGKLKTKLLIWWNIICLGLLFNIVINAILSAPIPLQVFAFDQPNVGVLHFPFTLLPTFIVPLVLFCHLVSIRLLIHKGEKD